jgi:hypothetical protein
MIAIDVLRTARLEVRMSELPIGDEVELCYLPDGSYEKNLSEFLRRAIKSAEAVSERHITDPRAWSVGERYLALAHYNRAVREDGPNYQVTESTKLGDYLIRDRDPQEPVTFEANDDTWTFTPATGAALEALEELRFSCATTGLALWLFGLMAIQLSRPGEERPDPIGDGEDYSKWLDQRITIMRSLPASDAEVLYREHAAAQEQAAQFFRVWCDSEGVIVMPKDAGGGMSPARFRIHSGFTQMALAITGKLEGVRG